MKKIIALVVVMLTIVVIFAGCSTPTTSSTTETQTSADTSVQPETSVSESASESVTPTAVEERLVPEPSPGPSVSLPADYGKGLKVGFALSNLENVIWNNEVAGMKAGAEEIGAEFTVANANDNVANQIANIENFITGGYDAIIVHSFDVEAFSDVVKKALDQGIIVCAYDDAIRDPSTGENVDYQFTLGCDNYQMGVVIGTMAADWLETTSFKDDPTIEFGVFNYPQWEFITDRENGMKDALSARFPNVKYVATQACLFVEDGVSTGENWILAYPDMKGIVAINDNALVGFLQAWKSAGKDINDPNFGTFGADGTTDGVNAIKQGTIIRGDCGLDVFTSGSQIVKNMCAYLAGDENVTRNVIFGNYALTQQTVDEWIADPTKYLG